MKSRRSLLILSFVIAASAYTGLLVFAPQIRLFVSGIDTLPPLPSLTVHFTDRTAFEEEPEAAEDPAPDFAAPPQLSDLLPSDTGENDDVEESLERVAAVPELERRIASEQIEREHDLTMDPVTLAEADTRIIEIAEVRARSNIEVPRRFVRPSPDTILPEDAYPTLRGESIIGANLGSAFGSGSGGAGQTPATSAVREGMPEILEGDPETIVERSEAHVLPQLTPERSMARESVADTARRERPYEFMDELVDITLDTFVSPGEKDGFFRIRITPKNAEDIPILPKDVTFVIDASGSILQRKLDQTAASVAKMIENLTPQDRFNIVVFRDTAAPFQPDLVEATPENKAAAGAFVNGIEAGGETDVYRAIQPVLARPPRKGAASIVVVMTDGRPTTGMRNARDIINALTDNNEYRNTVYAFAGGKTVNRYLLDLLAYRNKGEAHVISRIEDISSELPRFYRSFEAPILTNLEANFGRVNKADVYPREIPDFYRGRPVTIYGRFSPSTQNEFAVRLVGEAGSGNQKEIILKSDLSKAAKGQGDIARDWAFQKIYHLIAEISRQGETPELMDQLRRLSQQYDIKTSYGE